MQVFVAGTWSDEKARFFADRGFALGKEIALRGYDLASGPGTGMSKHVINGYRSVLNRGKVTFYLPNREDMEKVGEPVGEGADEIVETGLDYPLRNIFQVRASDALIIITGGDGSLEEAVVALADYNIPVAAMKDSGTAVKALEALLEIFPAWRTGVIIHESIAALLDHIDARLGHLETKSESVQLTKTL